MRQTQPDRKDQEGQIPLSGGENNGQRHRPGYGQTFFQNFQALRWKDQNDFTHSGRMQVNSRLTRDDLQSNYSDEMIAASLEATTTAAVLVTVLLLRTHDRVAEAERLEEMLARSCLKQS